VSQTTQDQFNTRYQNVNGFQKVYCFRRAINISMVAIGKVTDRKCTGDCPPTK
jgi:hypothetical protein